MFTIGFFSRTSARVWLQWLRFLRNATSTSMQAHPTLWGLSYPFHVNNNIIILLSICCHVSTNKQEQKCNFRQRYLCCYYVFIQSCHVLITCIYRADYFTFFARCVGYQQKIRIRHDDFFPILKRWYLSSIGIKHVAPPQKPETKYTYDYFYPKRWMRRYSSYTRPCELLLSLSPNKLRLSRRWTRLQTYLCIQHQQRWQT